MADLTGQQLGPFEIKELLGTGGFATVYRAHDPRLRSDVALKILAENHSLDPNVRERFIGEAHALRRVESQSIIEVFDIGETADARPYLVLEFADRGDLVHRRKALANNGWQPSPADTRAVVEAVSDALDAMHAEMLVHRDVTPSNLLIRSSRRYAERPGTSIIEADERFMLSDMGLVKDLAQGSGLTMGGGTAGFWAPEQRGSMVNVDQRTDIYAASALVVWFLTGALVLTATDWPHQVALQGWPASLISTLQRGMSYSPDGRHPDIATWRNDVLASVDQHPSAKQHAHGSATAPAAPAADPTLDPSYQAPVEPVSQATEHPHPVAQPAAATGPVAAQTPATPPVPAQPAAQIVEQPGVPTSASPTASKGSPGLVVAAAIVIVALIIGAFLALRGGTGELNPGASQRNDGLTAVTAINSVGRISIIGPETVVVGSTAEFRFETTSVDTVVWIDPSGMQWETPLLQVTPSTTGQAEVTALATLPGGSSLRAEFTFESTAKQ